MEDKDYDSSDSDDSDFVLPQEDLSDDSVQSDYDSAGSNDSDHENNDKTKKKNSKKQKHKTTKSVGKKRHNTNKEELTATENADNTSTIDEKERADSLWKSFLSDTGTSTNSQSCKTSTSTKSDIPKDSTIDCSEKQNDTSKPTKSEDVNSSVTNEIVKDNTENSLISADGNKDKQTTGPAFPTQKRDFKRRGITSVLSSMNKKTKLSTLEKSKLDWNQFKEENNLKEEISTFNRGKDGYLERQDFLQRADSRQFEIEKQLRSTKRSSR